MVPARLDTWLERRTRTFCFASHGDVLLFTGVTLAVLALYVATLLPGIGIGDTAEFQRVAPTLGIAHPTGYPLYTLLGWLWSHLPLGETPAWRMNLFSAVAAALAVGVVYLCGRALHQRPVVALAAALTLGTSLTFWSQATIAEVYGLALLIQALLILALLRWRAGRLPFWVIGLLFGLGLAHHRSIVLLVPGSVGFVGLTRRPRMAELGMALLALCGAGLLYLYLPLRAPPWEDPWELLWQHASGAGMTAAWLDLPRLWQEGPGRPLGLARQFVWPQFLPVGALLALVGSVAIVWRDRAVAVLLLVSYAVVFAFCSAYYVIDVDAFLLPAHLIGALLLGEGTMLLLGKNAAARYRHIVLLLPVALVGSNLATVQAANSSAADQAARHIMEQPIMAHALVIDERNSIERLRYLQAVEQRHPTIELRSDVGRQQILDTLAAGRAVYLLEAAPELGLRQWPEGRLWRVGAEPLAAETPVADDLRWQDGIGLAGYTLDTGPYRPGEVVPLTLAWEVTARPRQAYTLFVHLVGPDGTIRGQQDRAPAHPPTDQWQPGMRYVDLYGPALDPAAPAGRYRVLIGWYDWRTLERLPVVTGSQADSQNSVVLGEVVVTR